MKTKLLSYFKGRILPAMALTKNYARIVGVILFLIGLLGFAFRGDNSLPDVYLGGALILGFWGIVSGLLDTDNKSDNKPDSKGDK
jgi:xanthine/uracil permease